MLLGLLTLAGVELAGLTATRHGGGSATSTTASSPTTRPQASSTAPPASAATSSTAPQADITISAVGDTMLGNAGELPPDPDSYFDGVESELTAGADIVFANLEGTLTTSTDSKCGASPSQDCYAFKDPPSYAQVFKAAGFTILNDANNHSYDFGPLGQAQTVSAIHAAGLAQTGLPGEITVVRAGPGSVPVAFVAFAPYTYDADLLDLPAARALIEKARTEARIVVVYMHAGAEGPSADHVTGEEETYLGEDRGNPEAFAHMAIGAGASLVIASGPHVLRGMQFYEGHLIAYSLGNFADYGDFASGGILSESGILRVTLSPDGGFVSARLDPITLVGEGQPEPGGQAASLVAELSEEDFGPSAAHLSPSGVITPPPAAAQ